MRHTNGAREVVIVGGGVTGIAAFICAVRNVVASRVDIVDPRGIGNCLAFATTEDALLCNTSVETMSLLDDDPDDFLKWLGSEGMPASRAAFVPRLQVSRYMRARHAQYAAQADKLGIEHRHIRSAVSAVIRQPAGGYRVLLHDGDVLAATDVLICTGAGSSFVPEPVRHHIGEPRMFECLYPERRVLDDLATPSHVLVLGSRLTAVDAALLLCASGHSVVMGSPSGRLPAVRTATPRECPIPIDSSSLANVDLASPALYRSLMRSVARSARAVNGTPLHRQVDRSRDVVERLRREAALAAAGATHWQSVLVHYMDLAEVLLRNNGTPETRSKAIANCWNAVQRYLFAFPLETAQRLLRHMDDGRLRVIASVPTRLHRNGQWQVHWSDGTHRSFDAVVCATGFYKQRFHATPEALHLVEPTDDSCVAPYVSPDLRVTLNGSHGHERIWMAGVASYLGSPIVNAVYQAVRQVQEICLAWASDGMHRGTSSVPGPKGRDV